jgi:hypothetical protein
MAGGIIAGHCLSAALSLPIFVRFRCGNFVDFAALAGTFRRQAKKLVGNFHNFFHKEASLLLAITVNMSVFTTP